MKIFTYYDPVGQIGMYDERMLIAVWYDKWKEAGFDPFVLNEWWAQQHQYYKDYCHAVESFPSINPPGYDRACFLRWLAVAQAIEDMDKTVGGGIMVDYDTMPYCKAYDIQQFIDTSNLTLFQKHVPSVVAGSTDQLVLQCMRFADYKVEPDDIHDGVGHVSDMTILGKQSQREPTSFTALDVCKLYSDKGWETAPVVHFANQVMIPAGHAPRWKHIERLR